MSDNEEVKSECPFKGKGDPYVSEQRELIKEYDYCRAFRIKCVGESKCPIMKK